MKILFSAYACEPHKGSEPYLGFEILNEISKEYVNSLNALSNNSSRVTDKLPINFKWIGFIKLLLPKSKIIHCIRNPKDNCLSIFKTYFASKKLNFAYDLDEISRFYHIYKDMMDYWETLLPDFIFDAGGRLFRVLQ